MNAKDKRIVNYRPLFFIFVGLILGIIIVEKLLEGQTIYVIVVCSILLVLSAGVVFSLLFSNKILSFFSKNIKSILCVCFAIIIGGGLCFLKVETYSNSEINNNHYEISGRICDVKNYDSVYVGFVLENCLLDGEGISNNIFAMCYDLEGETLDIGQKISYVGQINCVDIINVYGGVNTFYSNNNLAYISTFQRGDAIVETTQMKFDEQLKKNVKQFLTHYMGADNAGLALAVLVGEKDEINNLTYQAYSLSGIAHILAISGLHIGFLVAMIYFILKKCKVNRYVRFSVLAIFLLLYCFICGFNASVVRASIMSLAILLSTIIGERSDSLTNLSVAGIILLLFNPLMVFDIGFVLSFSCVFGIICLYPLLFSLFSKIKIPKFINASMSICLVCQIATLPVCLNNFEFVSAVGFLTNLLCLPLFAFAFGWLFFITIIGLVFSGIGVLLYIPEVIFSIISSIAGLISTLDVGLSKFITFSTISIIMFLFIIFFMSNFVMIKVNLKRVLSIVLLIILTLLIGVEMIPQNFDKDNLIFGNEVDNSTLLTSSTNDKYLINVGVRGTEQERVNIEKFLQYNKVFKLNSIVLVEYKANTQTNLINLCNIYYVEKLYLPNNLEQSSFAALTNKLINTDIILMEDNQVKQCDDQTFTLHYFNESPTALEILINNNKIVFSATAVDADKAYFINQTFGASIDILRVNNYNKAMQDNSLRASLIIANNFLTVPNTNYLNLRTKNGLIYQI